jgi:hypothetical protein
MEWSVVSPRSSASARRSWPARAPGRPAASLRAAAAAMDEAAIAPGNPITNEVHPLRKAGRLPKALWR